MGNIIDFAKKNQDFPLVDQLRVMVGASTLGTLTAIVLFPSAVILFSRMIAHLEISGSLPQMVRDSVSIRKLKNARTHLRFPKLAMLSKLRIGGIPKRLVIMNCAVTAIYTIGVLAALLASAMSLEHSTAASQASGMINGAATILLTILIDPQIGLLTDKVLRREKDVHALNKVFGLLMLSRLLGTMLAQLLLVPAAYGIKWAVEWLAA